MSDESVNNGQDILQETTAADATPEDDGGEAPSRPVSAQELVQEIGDKDTARIISELLRGQEIASVYIDARSGGVFFGGEARVTGDVTGRSNLKRAASRARVTLGEMAIGQVLADDLRKTRVVYVKPAAYAQARQVLAERHVLLLWGQAHWGKWTTALHLLSTLQADDILEINPDVGLDELYAFNPEPRCAYVIDTLAHESSEALSAFALNRLSERFRKQQSYIVITVDSRASLSKEAFGDYLVTWRDLPPSVGLLEKHLSWYLLEKDLLARARELGQTDEVKELLCNHLLPGEIDRLAELLAEAVRGELQLAEALTRFEARARQQVEAWFETHTKLEERTFMLSLAVFSGANYQAAIEADEHLQSLIKPPPSEGESRIVPPVFGGTRSQRVREASSHIIQGYEEAEFGRSPVEIVVLDNPTFQPAVLHYVWHEYDRLRRFLTEWLLEFGLYPSFDVRARAAAAIGELSKYNFGYIRKEVLLPWANHQNSQARASAALALGIPAWEGEFAPQVLGLLHHWSTLRNNWRLSWTAAAAYGGLVGLRFPDMALRDLYNIAQGEDLRLLGVLNQSVANLFQAGRTAPDYYIKVLEALVGWTANSKSKIVTVIGLLIFLELARRAKVEADPEGGMWPTMLWLVREDEEYQDRVISLWKRALNTKSSRKLALEALHHWIRMVDEDTRLYSSVEQLVIALTTQGTARERDRLCFYLDRWASDPAEGFRSAARILAKLNPS